MEFLAPLMKLIELISEALRNVDKLPVALIAGGIVQAAAALALAIFKPPAGILLHHGKGPVYLYYSVLVFVVIFGFAEASAGFWVASDPANRRIVGKTVLWVSIFPLVLVSGLGGFVILK